MNISIKKSFIKDKNGNTRASKFGEINKNVSVGKKLAQENKSLQEENKFLRDTIAQHNVSQIDLDNKFKARINEYETELENAYKAKISLEIQNKKLIDEIQYLDINNKSMKSVIQRFNREFNEERVKLSSARIEAIKELKSEIKQWKKKLGRETKEKIKLKKKLDKALERVRTLDENKEVSAAVNANKAGNSFQGIFTDTFINASAIMSNNVTNTNSIMSNRTPNPTNSCHASPSLSIVPLSSSYSTAAANNSCVATTPPAKPSQDNSELIDDEVTCSICAEPIPDYIPKYFQGLLFDPTCAECDDPIEDETESDE